MYEKYSTNAGKGAALRTSINYIVPLGIVAGRASKNQRSPVWLICRTRRTNGTDSEFLLTPLRVLSE
jgi:hypothetical protein